MTTQSASVQEGDPFIVDLTLLPGFLSATWSTTDGTAGAGRDYVSRGGLTTSDIDVATLVDAYTGTDEYFYVSATVNFVVGGIPGTTTDIWQVFINEGEVISSGTSQTVSAGDMLSGAMIVSGGSLVVLADA